MFDVLSPVSADRSTNSLAISKTLVGFVVCDASACPYKAEPAQDSSRCEGSYFCMLQAGGSKAARGQEPNSFGRQVRGAEYSFCLSDTLTAAARLVRGSYRTP